MAYSENLATRIRDYFRERPDVEEKRMFGGLAFMVGGHMCVGVRDTSIFARIGPDKCNRALEQPGTRKMDFTGRALKGFVYVSENVLTDDPSLCQWIEECESFIMSLPPK